MEAVEAVEDVEGVGGCESAIFVCSVISDAENSRCTSTKLPSVTKALFQPPKKTFDHTKSGCDVTNNSFLHQ